MEETDTLDDSPSAQEEDKEMSTQLLAELPSRRNIRRSQKDVEGDPEIPHDEENPCFCPGIVDVLYENHLGIILGTILGFTTDKDVERWFGVVKQSIAEKVEATEGRDVCQGNVWLSVRKVQRTRRTS